jgi:N-acetylmuramoyl-L-alanine amidase
MQRLIGIFLVGILSFWVATATGAQGFVPPTELHLTYPPLQHTTVSDRLFFIGTAPKSGQVSINDQVINRSEAGHFAPSLPLQVGANKFQIVYKSADGDRRQDRQINVAVTREPRLVPPPQQFGLIKDGLFPEVNVARLPDDRICFDAIATPTATVSVNIGDRQISLLPRRRNVQLPTNSSVLTDNNQAIELSPSGYFRGCTKFTIAAKMGQPEYEVRLGNRVIKQKTIGSLEILNPQDLQVAEITAIADARTGASTDFSRLTPLPQGTRALVTGKQGNWLRLDYGGWVRDSLMQISTADSQPRSLVRAIDAKRVSSRNVWTEIKIPLEAPVPISIVQGDRLFTLTLHNVTAQTDTIAIAPDTIINKIDWQQPDPDKAIYTIQLKNKQQWGYKVRYQGSNLIISLKHPPAIANPKEGSLQGVKILIDAGHGSATDLGSRGATGYPEKDVTLITSKLLEKELQERGAIVAMTRTDDSDIELAPRVAQIEQGEPDLAVSVHYNALPDDGDALNTSGVGTFWYNYQAQDFAKFINSYIVRKLNRADYGVYWNNLALVRPTTAPSILLELGFMINPVEFEWIIDPQQQKLLAKTIADGITEWMINAIS